MTTAIVEMRLFLSILIATVALAFCACTSFQNSSDTHSAIVRVTTDAQGRVASVTITKSSGRAILDRYTIDHIKQYWHGPPNSSKEVIFEYKLQPKAQPHAPQRAAG